MKLGIVLVTYNRLNLLKKALDSIKKQTYSCNCLIVVDNNSTDGTREFLIDWKNCIEKYDKQVVLLDNNVGGSGGFYAGIKNAFEQGNDWIFVSDDDAFLENDCIEKLNNYLINNDCDKLSAICIAVKDKNGNYEVDHRTFVERKGFHIYRYPVLEERYNENSIKIDALSFVGSLINSKAIKKVGFPVNNFFIWHDDLEFSIRLKKYGDILLLPNIYIHHHDDINTGISYWKRYYGIRNYLITLKKHYPIIYVLSMIKYYLLYIPRLFIERGKEDNKLVNAAHRDALFNKLGINYNFFPKK